MTTATANRTSVQFESPGPDGVGRIVIDRPDDAVNAINPRLVDELQSAIRTARATQVQGLIVVSAKKDQWVAGADLKLVTQSSDSVQLQAVARRFQSVLDELAWLPFTTVAAINGAALGGGLELALACDYRVAAEAPSVSIGQPEVNLGLVPAGGGTQRLPRLIGLERALDLILSGRRLNARRARRVGIVDEVVHPSVVYDAARRWATRPKRSLDRPIHLAPTVRTALEIAELTPPGRQLLYRQARQTVLKRTGGHYPAPLRALEAVEIGFERGMAAGLDVEAQAFGELAVTDTAHNLIWLFQETQRNKRAVSDQTVERIGVVGAGFMGAAIAEVAAASGFSTRVRDVSPDAIARGLATARKLIDEGVARRRFEPREGRDILRRLSGTTDYSGFSQLDLIIEAVFEDLTVKRKVLDELEAVVKSETVIASNTSALPIRHIAQNAKHPERVVGMHFFSPAQRMPLLEVVRPDAAADWPIERAVAAGTKMGKTVIVVRDSPGFYTSRVLGAMLNEAALMLGEGADMVEVDRAMTEFGFPVGPFVLYDEVGLEVAQHAGETVTAAFGDRFPAATIVADLVEHGDTGRKSGRGFYIWPGPSKAPKVLRSVVPKPRRTPNPRAIGVTPRRSFAQQEIQDRLALLFVNEAIRCLDEGVLSSSADGDVGAVLGLGFPPFRGGPFHYADSIGAEALTATLTRLAENHGPRYEPAESLVAHARTGGRYIQ